MHNSVAMSFRAKIGRQHVRAITVFAVPVTVERGFYFVEKVLITDIKVPEGNRIHRCAVDNSVPCNRDCRAVFTACDFTPRGDYLRHHSGEVGSAAATIPTKV